MKGNDIAGGSDVQHECDVLVIGSGVSGYCAAIQAAREGCEVLLLEKDEVLGGNSGPNLGVGITGADRYNAFGTETGIIQELQEEAAWVNGFTRISAGTMPYNISRRNEAVVQSALEQAGVRVLKRHLARAPRMRDSRICGVLVEDLAAFHSAEVRVKGVVVEASGDGHIGALAGAIASFSGRAPVLEEIDKLDRLGITLIPLEEASYPELLRHISDPPPFLYVRGSLSSGEVRSVALVGSRRASAYGRRISRKIARDLARMGGCVVSGMARGIDTEAHKGALDGGGKTVAVLGCGVDVLYPPENGDLYRAILETGAIVSEFPPGTQPKPAHFPVRNRVISGLSRAVVVLEGTDRSGSLITAGFALDQGREVFALPGPVDSTRSAGPHRLIRDGAALIRSAADIMFVGI